ncbi:hypothetical protein K1X84_07400 [bacterium]|nr:hypothetical protein [bacterium]
MIRQLRNSISFKFFVWTYGITLLCVSNPYCYFSVMMHPLRVTLFLDIPDRDEDIFVNTCAEECTDDECYGYEYKEESRRDGESKNKLSFKIKLDTTIPIVSFLPLPDAYTILETQTLMVYAFSITSSLFHPPNLLS